MWSWKNPVLASSRLRPRGETIPDDSGLIQGKGQRARRKFRARRTRTRGSAQAAEPPTVSPPILSVGAGSLFYGLFALLLPATVVPGLFAGLLLGYLYYDYVHFATHHVKPPRAAWLSPIANLMKEQRRRHMKHHFQDHTKGFGVSMPLWDRVFGTLEDR